MNHITFHRDRFMIESSPLDNLHPDRQQGSVLLCRFPLLPT